MPPTSLVNLSSLIDDAKCYALVRQRRWPEGVRCPACGGATVIRHGHDDTQGQRQRYRCKDCRARFDDLTGTVLAGHHQPLRVWVLCRYLMGLNLSNRQLAKELDLGETDVQAMTEQLRHGLAAELPPVRLEGEVEIDEVYVVAGHKGQPKAVAKSGAPADAGGRGAPPAEARSRRTSRRSSACSDAAVPWSSGCWPMCGRRRSGPSSRRRSPRAPWCTRTSTTSTPGWGNGATGTRRCAMHARGEYARDGDGDGSCEVHVDTAEGLWSLLRSWLRPHRGVSQEKLPAYLASFQVVHNARRRGKALLTTLIGALVG
jgi:transposase-like protein